MLKKIAFAGVGIALLASPLISSADTLSDLQAQIQALVAQIAALQGQTQPVTPVPSSIPPLEQPDDYGTGTNPTGTYCPQLSITMQRGSRDATTRAQVSELQAFLTSYYNLDENIVVGGYFGNLTHKYVVQFQSQQGLPAFGIAGSLTRAKIAQVCGGGTVVLPEPRVCPVAIRTACPTGQHYETAGPDMVDSRGCRSPNLKCVPDSTSTATFSASPTSGLAPLEVTFATPNAGSSYSIDFGDGTTAPLPYNIERPGTFHSKLTHVYQNVGTYYARLLGGSCNDTPSRAIASICAAPTVTITVSGQLTPTITVISPNGGAYYTRGNPISVWWKTASIPSDNQMLIRLRSVATGQEYNLITTSNDGSESVNPGTVPAGAYTLEIKTAVGGQSYIDASDSYFKIVESTLPASIVVTAPNGGERFVKGNIFSAKWTLNGKYPIGTKICVNLTNQSTQVNNVPFYGPTGTEHCAVVDSTKDAQEGMISGQLGQGNLTTIWLPAGMYKARAFTVFAPNEYKPGLDVFDESDASFSVVDTSASSGITVTSPNGGERWEIGKLNTVTWAPYGYNPNINPASDVDVFLLDVNGYQVDGKVMDTGKASLHTYFNLGNYSNWAQPGQYYVKVVNRVTGASDKSDAPFTLLPKPVNLKINGSDGPVTLSTGQQVTVSWKTSGVHSCGFGGVGGFKIPVANEVEGSATGIYVSGNILMNCIRNDTRLVASDWVYVNALSVPAFLQVTSPNGGESIAANDSTQVKIAWRMDGISTPLSIALYKNDQWLLWIEKNLGLDKSPDGTYSYLWVPNAKGPLLPALSSGSNSGFKIYITGQKADGSGYVDDKSDAPFSFTASSPGTLPVIFSSPVGGSAYEMGADIPVRWSDTQANGLYLENVSTGKRTFWGDALGANYSYTLKVPGGLEPGSYRVIGYWYSAEPWRDIGVSNTFTIKNASSQTFWVRPSDASSICKYHAGVERYNVLESRDARCSGSRCVSPPFVWLLSNTLINEDRPSYLSADGMLQRVQCVANGAYPTTESTKATYRAYLNGSTYSNITSANLSEADALANCKQTAASNPNVSIRCTWGEKEIYSAGAVTQTGSAVPASWEANTFSVYRTTPLCTGDKFVGYSSKYGMWVGAQLCGSSDKYKLYMSTGKSGVYYQIADYGGHGQDHCELVNSSFTIPNDDDITSGTCKNCAVGNLVDVQNEPVFARSKLGETFKQVDSTDWADLTTDYYKCGVSIGSNTASASSANPNLASALAALESALKALMGKLGQ